MFVSLIAKIRKNFFAMSEKIWLNVCKIRPEKIFWVCPENINVKLTYMGKL